MTLSILVAGVGNIGARLAELAAFVPAAQITLLDPGLVKRKNLERQPFGPDDVGRHKVAVVAETLIRRRPDLSVEAVVADVRELSLDRLSGFDIVVAAVDSLDVEAWIADACRLVGVPMVRPATSAGEDGDGSATVRFFPALAGGACPRCSWGAGAWRAAGARVPCAGAPTENPYAGARQSAADGALAAALTARMLEELEQEARLLQLHGVGLKLDAVAAPLQAHAACPGEHHRAREVRSSATSPDHLVQEAAAVLGCDPAELFFDLGLRPLIELRACPCGSPGGAHPRSWEDEGPRCPSCGTATPGVEQGALLMPDELAALTTRPSFDHLLARHADGRVARFLPNGDE